MYGKICLKFVLSRLNVLSTIIRKDITWHKNCDQENYKLLFQKYLC